MINVANAVKKAVRETTCDFEVVTDAGEIETKQIRVRYHDWTTKQLKEHQAEMKARQDAEELYWNSEEVFRRLHSLPDIVGKDEKPVDVTLDFLESLDIKNLNRIKEAIETDASPKK